jgi:hypothetical protein
MGTKNYTPVQLQAKELGIKNWHVKKESTLLQEIDNRKEAVTDQVGSQPAIVPHVSYGQLLDILDTYAINNLASAFEALDNVSRSYYKNIIPVFDKIVSGYPSLGAETDLDYLYAYINRGSNTRITRKLFNDFIISIAQIYSGKGWVVNMTENKLYMPSKPTFKLQWHVDLWNKQSKDKASVYRILAILASPLEE